MPKSSAFYVVFGVSGDSAVDNPLANRNSGAKIKIQSRRVVRESPYIRFKTPALEQQWRDEALLHPALVVLVDFAAMLFYRMTNQPATITSLYRPDDPGVHGQTPCRGADLRTQGLTKEQENQWVDRINAGVDYLSGKPTKTALIHDVGKGRHLHVQIGPMEPLPNKTTQEA